jgi:NAD(P)-dependent dehydrogenase (short-subunit alcohol dehydrogenase family)
MSPDRKEQLVVLTGASRGLGRAMAAQLLQQPRTTLLCVSRHPDERLHDEPRGEGSTLVQWALDLADAPAAAMRLADWLGSQQGDRFGRAALVNNAAALSRPGALEDTPLAELSAVLRVGLEAALLLSAAFLRATAGWPAERRLLNVSSSLGRRAMAGSTAYCAVKAGMDHFSRAVALEQAALPNGARVVSLAPGVIDTDMQAQLRSADHARFPESEFFADLKSQGRLDSAGSAAAKVLAFLQRSDFGREPVADVRG